MLQIILLIAGALSLLFTAGAAEEVNPEVLARRTYFYVGGRYVNNSGEIFKVNQMYVEELTPSHGVTQKYPLVMWPGGGQTGTNFLNTPDNRQGWASYFLARGYQVYLVEQPDRGRSPWIPSQPDVVELGVNFTQKYFTASQQYGDWPQAHLHTQFPGTTGELGDPTFDAFYDSQVQFLKDFNETERVNRGAGVALLQRLGTEVILMTHSQSGLFGWGIADEKQDFVKSIVALEPQGPPFVNVLMTGGFARPYGPCALPLTYDPPISSDPPVVPKVHVPAPNPSLSYCLQQTQPPRKLVNLVDIPVLMVTSEASYHAYYDHCTATYLREAGINLTFYDLPTMGVKGNGHFVFLEKNSLEIAGLVSGWLDKLD